MPILKYVPPPKKILDRRSDTEGYYEAICECCGTKFYPARSNGRYCTSKCKQFANRMARAERSSDKSPKEKVSSGNLLEEKVTPTIKKYEFTFNSKGDVIDAISGSGEKTHGLLKRLTTLKVGSSLLWEGWDITKLSTAKYGLLIHPN